MKIVLIKWLDSQSHGKGGWLPVEEIVMEKSSMIYESVGYLITETEDAICLATSTNLPQDPEETHAQGILSIPKGTIVSRKTLKS